MNFVNFCAIIHVRNLVDTKTIICRPAKPFLAGGPMTQTKYEDQKVDHMSWIQWININLDNAKEFYQEVKINLREIISQTISRVSKELRFFISKLTTVDFFCGSITLGIMAFASLFLALGLGLVGYQVFLWIKDGVWSEFATMEVFNFLFENTLLAQWLDNPESWFGLQKIIEWLLYNIPVSVALIVPSIMVLVGMMCVTAVALTLRFYQFKSKENI